MQNTYFVQVLLVGIGGFIGSSARFVISGLVHRFLPFTTFPFGTLTVNILGCLAVGFLGGLLELRQVLGPSQRLFLMIGILGGFTTFSTFAYEALGLLHAAEFGRSIVYVVGHAVLGLTAAWLGYLGAQSL